MKLSYIKAFCLCAGILNGVPAPVFSAEVVSQKSEPLISAATASLVLQENDSARPEEFLASATFNSDETLTASATPENAAEPTEKLEETEDTEPAEEAAPEAVFDPFAAEPFAGTPLLRMKRRLQSLSETYFALGKTADLALATVAASSDDRFFRRTGEFSIRISRHLPFPSLAASLILPEFLGVADELMLRATRTLITSLIEARVEPLKRRSMLEQLKKMSELTRKIAACQRLVQKNISDLVRQLSELNSIRFIPAPPGPIFKSSNASILQLIEKYLSHWNGLLNQFDHHQDFFSGQLQFLADASPALPAVREAVHLNLMLRSLLDFKVSLEKYYTDLSGSPGKMSEWQNRLNGEIASYSVRNNSFNNRVKDFVGKFPLRDSEDRKLPVFSADNELRSIFATLEELTPMASLNEEKMDAKSAEEVTTETENQEKSLLELLRPYVDGGPWPEPKPEPATEETPEISSGSAEISEADVESTEIDADENTATDTANGSFKKNDGSKNGAAASNDNEELKSAPESKTAASVTETTGAELPVNKVIEPVATADSEPIASSTGKP